MVIAKKHIMFQFGREPTRPAETCETGGGKRRSKGVSPLAKKALDFCETGFLEKENLLIRLGKAREEEKKKLYNKRTAKESFSKSGGKKMVGKKIKNRQERSKETKGEDPGRTKKGLGWGVIGWTNYGPRCHKKTRRNRGGKRPKAKSREMEK